MPGRCRRTLRRRTSIFLRRISVESKNYGATAFVAKLFGFSPAEIFVRGPASHAESNRVAREAASRAQSNGTARGPGSLPESNSAVVNPNLRDRCFRVARQAPSLYGPTEGSASEAADVRLESFGLSRGLSAAAESAFPEGVIASILRDASGG